MSITTRPKFLHWQQRILLSVLLQVLLVVIPRTHRYGGAGGGAGGIVTVTASTQIKWTSASHTNHKNRDSSKTNTNAAVMEDAHTAPRSQKYWDDHGIERPDYAKTDAELAAEKRRRRQQQQQQETNGGNGSNSSSMFRIVLAAVVVLLLLLVAGIGKYKHNKNSLNIHRLDGGGVHGTWKNSFIQGLEQLHLLLRGDWNNNNNNNRQKSSQNTAQALRDARLARFDESIKAD